LIKAKLVVFLADKKNKPWDGLMVQELAKASEELPAADISVDVSANNGRDDAELSDTGEDPGDSAPLYTNKEEVYSTGVPSARVV